MSGMSSWTCIFWLMLLLCNTFAFHLPFPHASSRFKRNAPIAKPLSRFNDVRRSPSNILNAIGPLAFGHKTGGDTKLPINGLGVFGAGDAEHIVAKFVPEGSEKEEFNGGTYNLPDDPNMHYMDRETTTGERFGSNAKINIAGLGKIQLSDVQEQGTGLLDFSKNLMPFLELPPLKSDQSPDRENTDVDERIGTYFYINDRKPQINNLEGDTVSESPFKPATPFKELREIMTPEGKESSTQRVRPRAEASKTVEDVDLLEVHDGLKLDDEMSEGFIKQENKEDIIEDPFGSDKEKFSVRQKVQMLTERVPIRELGLTKEQITGLCQKFSKIAAQYCYGPKIPDQLVTKCQGYNEDCAEYQTEARPLGAVANAFSSGVGLTYYDWGVNGIPYYPVNEEGGIGNGHHGKIDFGTWGGGYSDNLGVRDFWSQTGEYGANWYEGTYGYKTGWSIPIVQSLGVEGGAGTQVHVPIKEGDFGKPIQVTNGYHVGPFIGLADRVGVDWYNGGISFNKGLAVPLIGVNVNSGTSIGFPSMGHIMNRMGLNGLDYLSESGTQTASAMSEKTSHSIAETAVNPNY